MTSGIDANGFAMVDCGILTLFLTSYQLTG